jgi:hypothetical protein
MTVSHLIHSIFILIKILSMCLDGGLKWVGMGSTHFDLRLVAISCVLGWTKMGIFPVDAGWDDSTKTKGPTRPTSTTVCTVVLSVRGGREGAPSATRRRARRPACRGSWRQRRGARCGVEVGTVAGAATWGHGGEPRRGLCSPRRGRRGEPRWGLHARGMDGGGE